MSSLSDQLLNQPVASKENSSSKPLTLTVLNSRNNQIQSILGEKYMATVAEVAAEREVQSVSSQESEAKSHKKAGKDDRPNSDQASGKAPDRVLEGKMEELPAQDQPAQLDEVAQPNLEMATAEIEKVEAKSEKEKSDGREPLKEDDGKGLEANTNKSGDEGAHFLDIAEAEDDNEDNDIFKRILQADDEPETSEGMRPQEDDPYLLDFEQGRQRKRLHLSFLDKDDEPRAKDAFDPVLNPLEKNGLLDPEEGGKQSYMQFLMEQSQSQHYPDQLQARLDSSPKTDNTGRMGDAHANADDADDLSKAAGPDDDSNQQPDRSEDEFDFLIQ